MTICPGVKIVPSAERADRENVRIPKTTTIETNKCCFIHDAHGSRPEFCTRFIADAPNRITRIRHHSKSVRMSSHAGNTNTVWVQTGRASARLPKGRIDSARFRTRKGTHRSSFVRIRQCRNDLLVIGHVDALDRDLHAEGRRDQRHTEGIHTTRSVVVRRYRSLPSATRAAEIANRSAVGGPSARSARTGHDATCGSPGDTRCLRRSRRLTSGGGSAICSIACRWARNVFLGLR
jgi:hypothetical protein